MTPVELLVYSAPVIAVVAMICVVVYRVMVTHRGP